jgi:hypothetical protein
MASLRIDVGPLCYRAAICIACFVASSCDSTGPTPRWPNGNFAAPFFDNQDYLAVSLRESGGIVSGTGWSSIDDGMAGGATLAGSYSAPAIHFDLYPRLGGTTWHFNGTRDSLTGSLSGEFAVIVGRGFPVVLLPVDRVPTGVYDLQLDDGTGQRLTGSAGFAYIYDPPRLSAFLRTQDTVSYQTGLLWNGAARPLPGTYPTSVSDSAGFGAWFERVRGSGIEAIYTLAPGTVTIEVSDRYVLTGHYVATAKDPTSGATIKLQGAFSAGCHGSRC